MNTKNTMIKNSAFLSGSLFLILMFSIVVVSFLSNDSCNDFKPLLNFKIFKAT